MRWVGVVAGGFFLVVSRVIEICYPDIISRWLRESRCRQAGQGLLNILKWSLLFVGNLLGGCFPVYRLLLVFYMFMWVLYQGQ